MKTDEESTLTRCQDCGAPAVGLFLGPQPGLPERMLGQRREVAVVCEPCGQKREAAMQNAAAAQEPN